MRLNCTVSRGCPLGTWVMISAGLPFLLLSVLLSASRLHAAEHVAGPKKEMRVFLIGNSLTDNINYAGLQKLAESRGYRHDWGRHMCPGAPIWWLWEHQDAFKEGYQDGKTIDYGYSQSALSNHVWDTVTLQPFSGYTQEIEAARKFIGLAVKKSPDVQICVYAQWMNRDVGDFDRYWLSGADKPDRLPGGTRSYYETFVEELRRDFPKAKPIRLIPVGNAMYLLNQKIKAGMVPELKDIFDVYIDGIHLGNVGAYVAGCSFFAVIYGESPIGLPVPQATWNLGYAQVPGNTHHRPLPPALAWIIQETVWEVVTTHPLTGVTCDLPVKVATPIIPDVIAGEAYTFDFLPAFGAAPCQWSVKEGELPAGLALDTGGRLAGTAAAAGRHPVQIAVKDASGGTSLRDLVVTVAPDSKPEIAEVALPPGKVGDYYRQQLTAHGGNPPIYWRLKRNAKLPRGMELHLDGVMKGSPAEEFDTEITVEAVDSDATAPETAERTFHLRVGPPAPELLTARRVTDKVTIDGKLDEPFWNLKRKVGKLVAGKACHNTLSFDVVFDGFCLDIAVKVLDNDIKTGCPDPWRNDSVEIFLDYFNSREKVYNSQHRRIVVDAAGQTHIVGLADWIKKGVQRIDGSYTVEIQVSPWNLGGWGDGLTGRVLGFDVACNDVDSDGNVTRVAWRGTKNNETDPSGFGTLLTPLK